MEFELAREHKQVPLQIKAPTISIIGIPVGLEMKGKLSYSELKAFSFMDVGGW